MPKRDAWSRLIVTWSCGALARRSLDTSASCDSVRIFSSSFSDHSLSSATLESCSVYWKLARETRPPTVMSCDGCRKSVAPWTLASSGRSRSMICAPVVLRFPMHEARAQHRRQRERDERGYGDRGRDGEREFAEHAADDAAHEQERDEHRNEREADGKHGEADLARARKCRLEGRNPILDVAVDVFHHHDGVVDDEAHRDGERHQRPIVEGEVEKVHPPRRSEEGERDRLRSERPGP